MESLPRTAAFLSLDSETFVFAHGPFARSAERPRGAPALYSPTFFLDDESPWFTAAEWTELPTRELGSWRSPAGSFEFRWRSPREESYAECFRDLMERIRIGELAKAVPVVFEEADTTNPPTTWLPAALRRLTSLPATTYAYGLWQDDWGMVGATPELLLQVPGDGTVRTMALAGTARPEDAGRLLVDPKEREEHQIVIDDVVAAMSSFGSVECGETDLLESPHLTHLRTEITLRAAPPFEQLVGALHPTPALGGSPRAASLAWLAERDHGVGRTRFGAPFGFVRGDGRAVCVVAIRNLQWQGTRLRLGSGSGIVSRSVLQHEWQELALKRQAVKRMLLDER